MRSRGDPGVVADDVDASEVVDGGVAQGLDRLEPRDVGEHPEHVGAPGPQLVDRGVERRLVHVGQHDLPALAGERGTHRLADAAATPGDDRDAIGEVVHERVDAFGSGTPTGMPSWYSISSRM